MQRLLIHQSDRFLGNTGFVGNWMLGLILCSLVVILDWANGSDDEL